ncbi:hypothetical protein [Yimella sp. cx-51]|uniref:hypothetical protein n=1 Tax=Yimella sp. cx-51 TaxID=2770551 RepID=UPI00165DA38A|nr:hypothetical protein [Yimella sp. cx-51]MBC9958350.1 hypothetical protein [Yimella sp. cx-51]QTH39732.1 hypothetical protein J5M86_15255 [Yimella sp. cx-51]
MMPAPAPVAAPPGLGDVVGCALSLPGCLLSKGAGKAVDAVADGAWEKIVKGFLEGMVGMLERLSTFWMKFPDPQLTNPSAPEGAMIGPMQILSDRLAGWVALCSLISVVVCCVRAIRQVSAQPFGEAAMQVMMLVAVQLGLAGAVQGGLAATSALSESLLSASGQSRSLTGLVSVDEAMSANQSVAVWFILALLAILSSLAQLMFMMMRGPLIMLLVLWMHFAAATAASAEGRIRAKKVIGLLISFMVYKPAAAAIYALGFMLIYGSGTEGATKSDAFMTTMYGFMTVLMAAIALPAVIRFIVPLAAATSSSAFSGGAAAGAVAAGSAVVATMGGSAAAAGGRAAARGSAVKSPTGRGTESMTTSGSSPGGGGSHVAAALMGGGGQGGTAGAGGVASKGSSNVLPSAGGGSGWATAGGSVTKSAGANVGGTATVNGSSVGGGAAAAPWASGQGSSVLAKSGGGAKNSGTAPPNAASAPSPLPGRYGATGGVKSSGTNPAPVSSPAPAPPAAPPRPSSLGTGGYGAASASSWRPNGSPGRGQGSPGSTRPLPSRPASRREPSVALPTWARASGAAAQRMSSSDRLIPPGH